LRKHCAHGDAREEPESRGSVSDRRRPGSTRSEDPCLRARDGLRQVPRGSDAGKAGVGARVAGAEHGGMWVMRRAGMDCGRRLPLQGLLWTLVFSDGLAEASGGAVNQLADVRRYGVQAAGNQRKDRGRVAYIERRELVVTRRSDDEAEANGDREDNYCDESNALHVCALPCLGGRCLRRGQP